MTTPLRSRILGPVRIGVPPEVVMVDVGGPAAGPAHIA